MTLHETMVYDSAPVACNGDGWGDSYSYDADDHTVDVNGACVGWGPDGDGRVFSNVPCPAQPGFGVANDTVHYDDDLPLFVTSAGPNASTMSIRLEKLGTLNVGSSGSQFVVGDREMSGNLVATHTDAWYSGIKFGSKVWQVNGGSGTHFDGADGGGSTTYTNRATVAIFPSTNNSSGYGATLGTYSYDASDGFMFNGKRFQGARVMDPVTGHWTSPDAYAGDVHDPLSQKPFMWNRNNPYAYSDPSGYCANPGGPGVSVCVDFYISAKHVVVLGKGNDRGPGGGYSKSTDPYKVRVNVNFATGAASVEAAHSFDIFGHDLGKGHDQGSTAAVHGNTAQIHISARCGPCPAGSPSIHADLTVSLDKGNITIDGTRGAYPSIEVYKYLNGKATQIFTGGETATPFGLTQTVPVKL